MKRPYKSLSDALDQNTVALEALWSEVAERSGDTALRMRVAIWLAQKLACKREFAQLIA